MSLITCCDHCRTVFRVTPEQLQAHGGQVRCGRCMQTFDALVALVPVDAPSSSPSPPEPPLPEPPPPADVAAVPAAAIADPAPAATEDSGALPDIPAQPSPAPTEPSLESSPDALPATHEPEQPRIQPAAAVLPDADNPFIDEAAVAPAAAPAYAPRRPWLIAASVLLGLVLAAQVIYFYRGEIAARQPLARQWLNMACARVGCIVALPQSPKAILIEASDLQSVDPARPNRIQLTATLRNHADHHVAYPALDLVLTNANDHTLARRIFLPVEYLGSGRDPRAGMAANAELTVRLGLDTGTLGAAGFRLAVLPAPER